MLTYKKVFILKIINIFEIHDGNYKKTRFKPSLYRLL